MVAMAQSVCELAQHAHPIPVMDQTWIARIYSHTYISNTVTYNHVVRSASSAISDFGIDFYLILKVPEWSWGGTVYSLHGLACCEKKKEEMLRNRARFRLSMWSSHEIEPGALRRARVKGILTVSRLEVLKTIGRNQGGERERGYYGPSRLNGLLPAFLTLLHGMEKTMTMRERGCGPSRLKGLLSAFLSLSH